MPDKPEILNMKKKKNSMHQVEFLLSFINYFGARGV
jgi:hypothetical protein